MRPYKKEEKPVAIKNLKSDEWDCDICDFKNKLPNYKCLSKLYIIIECLDINKAIYEKYKQKEFFSNQKEIVINDIEKDRESLKQRGYSEKKVESKNYNTNNPIKREDSAVKLNNCKCKFDEENIANYNIICKTCKKRRPERAVKTSKEISANIQKLTQELNNNKEDKSKSKVKLIGDDSFSNYFILLI